jgi:WD40 repeat protein
MKRTLWLAPATVCISLFLASTSWALDFGGLFGSGGDSGSGKVAHLEFRLKDGFAATSLVWSPDGKYIATSGTQTRLIHIWDVEQRKLVKEFELPRPPASQFRNMAWSPDGAYLATCNSFEAQLLIYDTRTWRVIKEFGPAIAGACQKPVFSDDGSELTIWAYNLVTLSVNDWRVTRMLKGDSTYQDGNIVRRHPDGWSSAKMIRDVAYVPGTHTLIFAGGRYEGDAQDCASASQVYTGRIWTLQESELSLSRSFAIHCSHLGGDDVTQIAIHPSAKQVAAVAPTFVRSGPSEPPVQIFDLQSGKQIAGVLDEQSAGFPSAVIYTGDARYLLVGQNNGEKPAPIYLIDPRSFHVLDAVHAPGRVMALAVHPRNTFFAAATTDGVTVWKFISQ